MPPQPLKIGRFGRLAKTARVCSTVAAATVMPAWGEGNDMPSAAMVSEINVLFAPPNLDTLEPKAFMPGRSADQAIKALGLQDVEYVRSYVEAMPTATVNAMLGAMFAALTDDPRSTVTVAWQEASHYAVTVSQTPAPPADERGAVTILLTGPLTPDGADVAAD